MQQVHLNACRRSFIIECGDAEISRLISNVFAGLVTSSRGDAIPARRYRVTRQHGVFRVRSDAAHVTHSFVRASDLIFHLDKGITVALQRLRPDLFFLHGAALGQGDRAVVLAAPPGTGKSTLTMVALERGLAFLSDELAPIDLQDKTVCPYRRSVCLKSFPPAPYRLPDHVLHIDDRYYVEPRAVADCRKAPSNRLEAIVFLRRDASRFNGLRRITAGTAATRMMANALNLRAHAGDGLDAAIALAESTACFELDATDLRQASAAIQDVLMAPLPSPADGRPPLV